MGFKPLFLLMDKGKLSKVVRIAQSVGYLVIGKIRVSVNYSQVVD